MLHSNANKFGKLSSGYTGLKKVRFRPLPKMSNAKDCSNYHTIALISPVRKIMLKILQARFQHYINWKLLDVQAGFRKGRETRDQIANIRMSSLDKCLLSSLAHFLIGSFIFLELSCRSCLYYKIYLIGFPFYYMQWEGKRELRITFTFFINSHATS